MSLMIFTKFDIVLVIGCWEYFSSVIDLDNQSLRFLFCSILNSEIQFPLIIILSLFHKIQYPMNVARVELQIIIL